MLFAVSGLRGCPVKAGVRFNFRSRQLRRLATMEQETPKLLRPAR